MDVQLSQQKGEAQRLQQELSQEQELRARLEVILARATAFLRDILQVSRAGNPNPSSSDIDPLRSGELGASVFPNWKTGIPLFPL